MRESFQAVHNIAIETSKSAKTPTSFFRSQSRLNLPPSRPRLTPEPRGQRQTEPTILDTLQQLSALASGSQSSRNKGSIFMMDQDKPIAHKENQDQSAIKQETD